MFVVAAAAAAFAAAGSGEFEAGGRLVAASGDESRLGLTAG